MLSVLLATCCIAEPPSPTRLAVRVDSARGEVVVTAGPFPLTAAGGHHQHHGEHRPLLLPFQWPVSGWVRGFAARVTDQAGEPVAAALIHHLNVINFERRHPVYDSYERLVGVGQETGDLILPRGIGVPLGTDNRLALLVAWSPDVPAGVEEVALTLRFKWLPSNTAPAPMEVLPVPLDVDFAAGTSDAFDLPIGRSSKSSEFTLGSSGRVLAIGGHLHNFGQALTLEEVATGRVLVKLEPKVAADRVVGMPRQLPGVKGDGILLRAGHRYRVTALYDNPTGSPLVDGGMGVMGLLFAPASVDRYIAALGDPSLAADLRGLTRLEVIGSMPDQERGSPQDNR